MCRIICDGIFFSGFKKSSIGPRGNSYRSGRYVSRACLCLIFDKVPMKNSQFSCPNQAGDAFKHYLITIRAFEFSIVGVISNKTQSRIFALANLQSLCLLLRILKFEFSEPKNVGWWVQQICYSNGQFLQSMFTLG